MHPGNRVYLELIAKKALAWLEADSSSDKNKIVDEVIHAVSERDPPGRFLAYSSTRSVWFEAQMSTVCKKVRRGLRESSSELRAPNGAEQDDKVNTIPEQYISPNDFLIGRRGASLVARLSGCVWFVSILIFRLLLRRRHREQPPRQRVYAKPSLGARTSIPNVRERREV
jgi:hypothetical protein